MTEPVKESPDEKRTSSVVDDGATPVPSTNEPSSPETASPIESQKQTSTDTTSSETVTEAVKNLSIESTSPTSETTTLPSTETDQPEKDKTPEDQPEPVTDPLIAQLKAQLFQQRTLLDQLHVERSQYRLDNQSLTDRLGQIKTKIQQRTDAQHQLESNYLDHIRAMRATPDDMDSIALKLRQLKKMIRELADELLEQADPVVATQALRTFWLNLHDVINAMGSPLPLHRVRMLTEKFMMDVLVQNMNLNVFPGHPLAEEYTKLSFWLDKYDTETFSTRLRQETALIMVKPDMQKTLHEAVQANWKFLYGGLIKAYPFVYQFDKHEPNTRIHYGAKVQKLVELSMSLGFAMKGQEVDVAAAETRERVQLFDPALMVDEDGQKDGIVDFCVCPPFVIYGSTLSTLEKGRVLCSPVDPTPTTSPIST